VTAVATPTATSAIPAWCSLVSPSRDAGGEQRRAGRVRPEARVPRAHRRDGRAERDGEELVERAEDRRRQPAEREEVRDGGHPLVRVQPGGERRRDPRQRERAGEQEQGRGGEVLAGEEHRARRRRDEPRRARRGRGRLVTHGCGGGHRHAIEAAPAGCGAT
jgi:hypothetical protein